MGCILRNSFQNYAQQPLYLNVAKDAGGLLEHSWRPVATAYRGELLGLMAIHLIFLSVNKMNRNLSRSMEIVSDCLGALKRISYLPPYRIPSRCHHLDVLKTILVHCRGLSFTTKYLHIKAHQDNNALLSKLSRKAQLGCICNHAAKQRIVADGIEGANSKGVFPLEPIKLFVHGKR
jgi:hypothetical protein